MALLALALLTACGGDGSPGTAKRGDDFDQDDIKVAILKCAGDGRPAATARVTANTSPRDRKYFVGLEFLDSKGNVIDSSSQKLTPESDSGDEEISAEVTFPMSEPEKADRVDSCRMEHAF